MVQRDIIDSWRDIVSQPINASRRIQFRRCFSGCTPLRVNRRNLSCWRSSRGLAKLVFKTFYVSVNCNLLRICQPPLSVHSSHRDVSHQSDLFKWPVAASSCSRYSISLTRSNSQASWSHCARFPFLSTEPFFSLHSNSKRNPPNSNRRKELAEPQDFWNWGATPQTSNLIS